MRRKLSCAFIVGTATTRDDGTDGMVYRYKLDSSFLSLPQPEALQHLERSLTTLRESLATTEELKTGCEEEMEGLKSVLYEKFGSEFMRYSFRWSIANGNDHGKLTLYAVIDSINLERGD